MKIMICGAGRVGYGIARRLSTENNVVTVIDNNPNLIRSITNELDVKGYVGHGAHPDVLKSAGIADIDLLIAVTHSDEVNMVACQVAHSLFDVPTKIARVRAQSYLGQQWSDLYSSKNLPIDIIISPEVEIGETIVRRLRTPGARDVVPFSGGLVSLLGVRVDEDSPIIATPVNQLPILFSNTYAEIIGIGRGGQVFAPNPDDPLEIGDDAYIITKPGDTQRLLQILGTPDTAARQIVIIGGGSIGTYVARALEKIRNVRVRIIERDKAAAETAASELNETVVLHGDAMSAEIQDEANVGRAEMVLCLTNDDKTNILAAVLAKSLGARAVGSLVNDIAMQDIQSDLDIDMLIDPRASTVSSILRHVRRGRILDVYTIDKGQAEVLEGEVLDTSPLAGKPVSTITSREGVSVGAIIRDNIVLSLQPDLVVREGDHLILLAERRALRDVEQLFRVSMDYF